LRSSIFFDKLFLQQHKIRSEKAHSGAAQNAYFSDGVVILMSPVNGICVVSVLDPFELLLSTAAQNQKFNSRAAQNC
jgi:hypothetical protein